MVPLAEGEKTYQVPCRSPSERQPMFAAVRSVTAPVLLELLLNCWPLQMVLAPMQSCCAAGGGSQVTVLVNTMPVAGGDPELNRMPPPVVRE